MPEGWSKQLKQTMKSRAKEAEKFEALVQTPPPEVLEVEEIEIDVDKLTAPDHITVLNERIGEMLGREHLTPTDLKTIAEAKETVLGAVIAYMDILEFASEE